MCKQLMDDKLHCILAPPVVWTVFPYSPLYLGETSFCVKCKFNIVSLSYLLILCGTQIEVNTLLKWYRKLEQKTIRIDK